MTPEDAAAIHSAAFGDKGWDAATFRRQIADPAVRLHGTSGSFALTRVVAGEAEILTLATHPDHQGQGRAGRMLAAALIALRDQGAQQVFLEVAADNAPARALYASAGFAAIAERKDYYRRDGGVRVTALVLRKDL